MGPKVTVIICTYNRAKLLVETLPTLFNQDISCDQYNVLIVNNNSSDNTSKVIDEYFKKYTNLAVIEEKQQGLSYAKNVGIKSATTEWIIYLDDDAKVPKEFVRTALELIDSEKYDCFGGVYYPWYKYGKPKWYKDYYASTADLYKNKNDSKLTFASGGIMAIKKSLLQEFGGFETKIGMSGNTISYGEETHLQIKLKNNGHLIGICPEWSMEHIVQKYKLKPIWFIKNGYATGRDAWVVYLEEVKYSRILKYLFFLIRDLFVLLFGNTLKLFKNNYKIQNWFIDTFQPVSIHFGRILGGLKYLVKR